MWYIGNFRPRVVVVIVAMVVADSTIEVLGASDIVLPKNFQRLNTTTGTHPCSRECTEEDVRTCYYHFVIEYYYVLSMACHDCPRNQSDCYRPDCITADGHKRGVVVVNRQMPGPPIELCVGDRLVVDLDNQLSSDSSTIHWHGVHQAGSPHMDGAPHVTQCPVLPGAVFRYDFVVKKPGTHFWHSHSGFQRSDGAYGALIVRSPRPSPENGGTPYEDRHVLLLTDWIHQLAIERFVWHHHSDGDNKPEAILINGRGRPTGQHTNDTYPPLHELVVRENVTYRIRLISNGVMNCPLQFSIDNHPFQVIATDGVNVQPITVDSVVVYAGERYDILVDASRPLVGAERPALHWIRVVGLMDCDQRFTSALQVAVLRYETDNDFNPVLPLPTVDNNPVLPPPTAENNTVLSPPSAENNPVSMSEEVEGSADVSEDMYGAEVTNYDDRERSKYPQPVVTYANSKNTGHRVLSPLNVAHRTETLLPVTVLNSTEPPTWDLAKKPDRVFYIDYDFNAIDNPMFHHPTRYPVHDVARNIRVLTPQLNNITMKMPVAPPLTQPEDIDAICNIDTLRGEGRDCTKEFCHCTHVLDVPLHATAEVFLIDRGVMFDANHPLHLHGYSFYVVAMERLGRNVTREEVISRNQAGLVPRNTDNPPLKDTVTVPDGGYTALRFHADNPGWWLFHCHMNFHSEIGMSLLFKVGDEEQMPKPPEGFPRCGSFIPHSKYQTQSTDGSAVTTAPAPPSRRRSEQGLPSSQPSAASTIEGCWVKLIAGFVVLIEFRLRL